MTGSPASSPGWPGTRREFGLTVLGGDTAATPGPTCLSLTILGTVAPGTVLRRGPGRGRATRSGSPAPSATARSGCGDRGARWPTTRPGTSRARYRLPGRASRWARRWSGWRGRRWMCPTGWCRTSAISAARRAAGR